MTASITYYATYQIAFSNGFKNGYSLAQNSTLVGNDTELALEPGQTDYFYFFTGQGGMSGNFTLLSSAHIEGANDSNNTFNVTMQIGIVRNCTGWISDSPEMRLSILSGPQIRNYQFREVYIESNPNNIGSTTLLFNSPLVVSYTNDVKLTTQ